MRPILTAALLLALASCTHSTTGGGGTVPGFVVFFTERSSALEPAAADVVGQAAAAANAAPGKTVLVRGWTDSAGTAADDIALSQQRAQRVADGLVADGVAASRITRQGRGQTGGDPGVESRRVEIMLSN